MAQQFSSCADTSTPTTFSVKGATYVKVLTWHFTTTPNSTQLAFEVVNAANGISIPCSLQNVEINGQWGDDSNYWYSCSDRSLTVDEKEYPVRTNAHIIWDDWKLTVNQTWDCGGESAVRHISSATLAPTCQEFPGDFQYVSNCEAPDLEAAATTQESDISY
ncbi:hypothetical protein F4821DRAFT_262223 [Hypoxylon rubiginosum]|uniref:Uncharacterized protein n=1 Tax=Hypoxylon rubiginosum TaxID=110542 RepID=A0ACC0CUK4_9PEZI|nr:hypothetical protein F4821DRAFT_262223 [Hypoxylon rubiginosum]